MKRIIIETHCHSCYSHDCHSPIKKIIKQSKKRNVTHIIINDHDCYELSVEDETFFSDNNITLLKAIEFTTKEGVHVIGVNDKIKDIEKRPFSYSCKELIMLLKKINGVIIIPHPMHGTGIIGNKNVDKNVIDFVLSSADFIEKNNRKYGCLDNYEEVLKKYPNLTGLIGSDAHKVSNVAAFVNEIDIATNFDSVFEELKINEIRYVVNKQPSKSNIYVRKIKRSVVYQFSLSLMGKKTRKKIKNLLKL
jgi:predicted metal-dependent phosphoesterase TrpH